MSISLAPAALGVVAATLVVSAWPAASPGSTAQLEVRPATDGAHRGGTWPVAPAGVLRGFDAPSTYAPGHRGVDLSADPGQPVASSLGGTVTVAGPVAGRSVVVVEHVGGLRTTYLPVQPTVTVGEVVSRGEPVGHLLAGPHCGVTSCLHWGARLDDNYIDPLELLGGETGQVVLLPPPQRASD